MKCMNVEKTIKSDKLYQGKIINLRIDTVELPNQKYSKREIIEHCGGVAVIAVHDGKIILVKQYRKAVEKSLYELPAGKLEAIENPLECAKRELIEETGYEPQNLKFVLNFYSSPGFSNEMIHLFIADRISFVGASPDEDEYIEVVEIPFEDAFRMVSEGEIIDAKTIVGLLYLMKNPQLD
ncbi:MAG: NUDIX hydrolase [Peptostreptococcaceae bacterium]|nr:NUDIX hydrolase [Peptostreptococcaceae bacterium]